MAVGLAAVLPSCGTPAPRQAGPEAAAPAGAEAAQPAFSIGDEFWFADSQSFFVEVYDGMENGRLVFRRDQRREVLLYTPDLALAEIRRPFSEGQTFEPDDGMLSFPLRLGRTWSRSYRVVNQDRSPTIDRTRRCEVMDYDRVDVPAGRFDAYRVECTVRSVGDPRVVSEEAYYAPDVGRIILYRSDSPAQEIRLTRFNRAR